VTRGPCRITTAELWLHIKILEEDACVRSRGVVEEPHGETSHLSLVGLHQVTKDVGCAEKKLSRSCSAWLAPFQCSLVECEVSNELVMVGTSSATARRILISTAYRVTTSRANRRSPCSNSLDRVPSTRSLAGRHLQKRTHPLTRSSRSSNCHLSVANHIVATMIVPGRDSCSDNTK